MLNLLLLLLYGDNVFFAGITLVACNQNEEENGYSTGGMGLLGFVFALGVFLCACVRGVFLVLLLLKSHCFQIQK